MRVIFLTESQPDEFYASRNAGVIDQVIFSQYVKGVGCVDEVAF
jgi:hypothetical protein